MLYFHREEQYKQLWAELDVYIEGASTTSPNHKKVMLLFKSYFWNVLYCMSNIYGRTLSELILFLIQRNLILRTVELP